MTIYIDELLTINLLSSFLLLLLTKKILSLKTKRYRLILASLLGGLSALIILLPKINNLFNLIISILITSIISFVGFYNNSIKSYLRTTLVLFFVTFLYSGIIYFLSFTLKNDNFYVYNNVTYLNISPILLILLSALSYIMIILFEKLRNKRKSAKEIFSIRIICNEKEFYFNSMLDTCMSLVEPFSSSPVILCENELVSGIERNDKFRIIPYKSLGGDGVIKGYKAQDVYINNKKCEKDIYIGICNGILKGEYKSLIGNNTVGDING